MGKKEKKEEPKEDEGEAKPEDGEEKEQEQKQEESEEDKKKRETAEEKTRIEEEKGKLRKEKAGAFETYLQESGLSQAFQLIFAEIVAKQIADDKVFEYASQRLRSLKRELDEGEPAADDAE